MTPGPTTQIPCLADLIHRGDGTWLLKPTLPTGDSDAWITPQQAARLLGISKGKVYVILEDFLVYRRPLPRRIIISLLSVKALRKASLDREFWTNKTAQDRLKFAVRKAMDTLVASSLQPD